MLQAIRDRAHGWIAWVIVGLIAVPFALWGIQEYFGVDPNVPVADVNGDEIPLSEFRIAYQRRQQALAQRLGQRLELQASEERRLKSATVESLIEDQLVLQLSDREGLRISDEQLAVAITTNPNFVVEGAFSQGAYDTFLARSGYSPGRFEETLRQNMLSQQLVSAFARAAIVTDSELKRLRSLQAQNRTFTELVVKRGVHEIATVTDEQVQAHYDKNRGRYVTDERMQVQYLALERAALEATIEDNEDALRSVYENQVAMFTTPEQRRASHILISVNETTDDATALEAVARIKADLDAGADFATLAKEKSDDPGSASRGGDLGFLGKGLMDPKFEQVAFSLAANAVSEPVRSTFGYHLILVTDIRVSKTKPFEDAREDVRREYRRQQGEQLYYEQVEELTNLVFEHPDNLEVASETLGLELKTTEFFSQSGLSGNSIFSDPKVLGAAFSSDVRDDRNNSEPLEIEGPQVVVLRVVEHEPSAERPLDAVRDEITKELQLEAGQSQAQRMGKDLLGRLRAGEDPQTVANDSNAKWSENVTATRTRFDVTEAVRAVLFRMPKPKDGGAVYDATVDAEGNFRILRLTEVADPDDPDTPPDNATLKVARQGLSQLYGQSTYRAVVDALRADASVDVFPDRL